MALEGATNIGGITVEIKAVVSPGEAQKAAQQIKQEVQQALNSAPVQTTIGGGGGATTAHAATGGWTNSGSGYFLPGGGPAGAAPGFMGARIPQVGLGQLGPAGIFAQTQQAVATATQQAAVQAQQAVATAVRQVTSGGGGINYGIGGGGGRAMSPYMNPFSSRGLARMVGSGLAVYGGQELLKLGTAYAESQYIANHPERVFREYEAQSSGNIQSDSYLRGSAQRTANIHGQQRMNEGMEAIPVMGTLVQFGNALSGTTAALKDAEIAIQQGAAAHIRALEYMAKAPEQTAAMLGDKTGATYASGARAVSDAEEEYRRHPNDPAVAQKLHHARRMADSASRIAGRDLVDSVFGKVARAGVTDMETTAQRTQTGEDRLAAFDAGASTKLQAIKDHYASRLNEADRLIAGAGSQADINTHIASRNRVTLERSADIVEHDAVTRKEREKIIQENVRDEKREQAQISTIRATGAAARLNAEKRTLEAELMTIKAHGDERLAAVDDIPKNANLRSAIRGETDDQMTAARIAHQAARLQEKMSLDTRLAVAKDTMGGMSNLAGTDAHLGAMLAEMQASSPEAMHQRGVTLKAEMDAMKYDLTHISGGGMSRQFGADAVIGDPNDWSNSRAEKKRQLSAIDEAKKSIDTVEQQAAMANIKKCADALAAMLAKGAQIVWGN